MLIHECNAGESGERGTVEERARRSMTAKQLRRRVKIVESKIRLIVASQVDGAAVATARRGHFLPT